MLAKDPVWRRHQLNKILWISGIWMAMFLLEYFNVYGLLKTNECTMPAVSFERGLLVRIITTTLGSIIAGTATVVYFEKWFRTQSYIRAIGMVIITYTLLNFMITGIGFTLMFFKQLYAEHTFLRALFERVTSFNYIRAYIIWFVVILLTTITLMVSDKYGPGVLKDLLSGRYFTPRLESRTFMFLDLRGSTTIAEQLGQRDYFNFLKELFTDVTDPILYTKGEIYQYVGDEIIVSWPTERGVQDANCIKCFYGIQEVLGRKAASYLENYGYAPEMKAGLHSGEVLAGEIGVIKRDITYTGDVLNTASRIQSSCNQMDVNILISETLMTLLQPVTEDYQPKRIGSIEIRGKQAEMVVYTL